MVGRVVRAHGLRGEVRAERVGQSGIASLPARSCSCFDPRGVLPPGRGTRRAGRRIPAPAALPPADGRRAPMGRRGPSRPGSRHGCGRRTVADPVPVGGRRELRIEEVRFTTGALLVALAGVEDRTAAEKLRGCVLEVPASSLPELAEDEYYPFELRGLRVLDEEGWR